MTRSITIIALTMAAAATGLGMSSAKLETHYSSWGLISPYLSIIHGNLNRYWLNPGRNKLIEKDLCTSRPVYVDYSIDDDCYVVVCNDAPEVRIRVVSMSKARSERKRFKADNILLHKVGTGDDSHFALDWIHGLLYFTKDRTIYIVDIKQESPEEMPIYTANRTKITGLVVRPDLSTLVWIEYNKRPLETRVMQSTQDGKNATELYFMKYDYLENLKYDYISEQYLAIAMPQAEHRQGWIFRDNFRSDVEFKIKIHGFRGNQVILYDNYLIFEVSTINDTSEWYIGYWDIKDGYNINGSKKLFAPGDHSDPNVIISLLSEDPRGNDIENRCQGHLCKHEHDFCVPKSARTYICMSNPNHIYMIESYLSRSKWLQFVLMTFIMLLLTLLVIVVIIITKKKVRFYQIRLKSINRVNSARLEVKTPATNEVAE